MHRVLCVSAAFLAAALLAACGSGQPTKSEVLVCNRSLGPTTYQSPGIGVGLVRVPRYTVPDVPTYTIPADFGSGFQAIIRVSMSCTDGVSIVPLPRNAILRITRKVHTAMSAEEVVAFRIKILTLGETSIVVNRSDGSETTVIIHAGSNNRP
jgi:uncharacterized lipoprotein